MSDRILKASLWRQGQAKIDWAARFMPVTHGVADQLRQSRSLVGLHVALVLVLEPKTANLALGLSAAGARVSVMCRAANTHDDVAAALDHAGVEVFARSDASPAQDQEFALCLLEGRPDVLVDDGSSIIRLAHTDRPDVLRTLRGATEETTSGVRPLRVMERDGALRIPVIAANDARCKTLFDNRHGTGQSTVFAMLDVLRSPIDRASVVVAGYGPVGRGVARHASALGARVTVTEVDPVCALEAVFDGFEVRPLAEAARAADLLISATGIAHTVDVEHLRMLPEGAAVAVAGGVSQEIAIEAALAAGATTTDIGPSLQRLDLPGRPGIVLLDEGGCINCSAAEGNPIEIMDLSFGVQAAAVDSLAQAGAGLAPGVHAVPEDVDHRVARAKLAALGVGIDQPSTAQRDFLDSWAVTRPRPATTGAVS